MFASILLLLLGEEMTLHSVKALISLLKSWSSKSTVSLFRPQSV